MDSPKLISKSQEVTYFSLNNELNRPVDGRIPLHKDKEAVRAFFLEHVNPNTVFFYTLDEKLDYLIEHDFLEEDFLNKYDREFVKSLMKAIYKKKFRYIRIKKQYVLSS